MPSLGESIGLTSSAITVVGFAITLYQLFRTRRIAQLTREAAELALDELRRRYRLQLVAGIRRQLIETALYVTALQWEKASLRCGDLAESLAQLNDEQLSLHEIIRKLREWSHTFLKIQSTKTTLATVKWNRLVIELHELLDAEMVLFPQPIPGRPAAAQLESSHDEGDSVQAASPSDSQAFTEK